jgi:hypothetical protein
VSRHDEGKLVWGRLRCAESDEPCPQAPASTD